MSTIKAIAQNCLLARFSINPVPQTLKQSVDVYTHLNTLGPLIQYNQAICPVTKKRLESIKVLFHDVNRQMDVQNSEKGNEKSQKDLAERFQLSFPTGDLVRQGHVLFSDETLPLLSELERALFSSLTFTPNDISYTLSPFEVSRNFDKVMHGTLYSNSKWLKIHPKKSVPLTEVEETLQRKRDEVLKGFRGLW
jgi:hypothetical protein